ncbi:NmrA-like family protein [Chitinophaga jiangningensis]|uniref:NmrA-like family protein n=1 Tax=Chitinophaga jiangningensis TaxID=1419482 RepID=A0A1M7JCZ3_9BACT|nr:aromatic alcohol reductase [Chitinophaga jiangningensis]SHM50856.1 NmrA-like family protein [Chitinophaga jiangningensis]
MNNSFLVIGTGEVGLSMLQGLYDYQEKHQLDLNIAALVQPDAAVMLDFEQNTTFRDVHLEAVDLVTSSVAELAKVFGRYDTVICCSGFSIGQGMQVKITEAVLQGGVRRYVPWQFGVDYDQIGRGSAQPVFDEQLDVRDLLRAQDKTQWVIVSTGMITSFLFREDFGVISLETKTIHALGDWNHSLTLTSCEDIGKLTVQILFHQPEFVNEVVFVSGETATFTQIAERVEEVFDTTFERVLWSREYLSSALQQDPDNVFNKYRMVFTHPGVKWPMEKTFNYHVQIPTIGIVDWAKKNLLS